MLKTPVNLASAFLRLNKSHFHRVTCTASWSSLSPLAVSDGNRVPKKAFLTPRISSSSLQVVPLGAQNINPFHTSSPHSRDFQDEIQKRFKHMMQQVDLKAVKNAPQPALVYGCAGLIPFVFPPLAILLNGDFIPNLAFSQLAYGAVILSFLGGVRWGFAMPDQCHQKLSWKNLGSSVSLSLVGWGSLILPPWLGTITLLGGLGAATYIDIVSPGYPQWFKALRLCLSTVAMGSIAFGLLLRMLF